jgi:hypothetical protein
MGMMLSVDIAPSGLMVERITFNDGRCPSLGYPALSGLFDDQFFVIAN